ncbi:EAL domain-containing protein [Photobacterium aphoticum]|uniref:EAL domain-containing protein n=1 Tax=Photobacterium aphoticum TaxID=754436 RepID=UPI001E419107|nr:EAL domain-containing protein [Photobacterium aphoticum]
MSYLIENDSRRLLKHYADQINDYPAMMNALREQLLFDCSAYDKHQLKHITYNDYQIRRMTLSLPDGTTCTSFDGANNQDNRVPLISHLTDDISLWVATEPRFSQQIMVVEQQTDKGGLNVYMEPLATEGLRNKYCGDCVLTSLSSEENLTVAFWRGDASLLSQSPLFSTKIANGLRLNAFVNPKLLEQYKHDFWLPLFLLGTVTGGLCLVLYRLFLSRRLSLHALIEQGLERDEFVPFYQPIVDVSNNSLYGCEMLARWVRAGGDTISPMEFIPYVEKSGQIFPITDQLLRKAVRDIGKLNWHLTQQVMSINVVPDQLESMDIMQKSLALLHTTKIAPSQIAFEVTERKRFTNLTMASDVIEQLRDCGIDVKLDDAGTGYGGFSYIQQLNIRSLKIDKMFVETIGTSDIKLSLLDSIIAFGKEAGMEMIAEGVETFEQSSYLAARGVTLQQGFYFGKPMAFRDFAYYCKSMVSR